MRKAFELPEPYGIIAAPPRSGYSCIYGSDHMAWLETLPALQDYRFPENENLINRSWAASSGSK